MLNGIVNRFKKFIGDYGMQEQPGIANMIMNSIVSFIIGYNYPKYWKRRQYVVNPESKNIIKKIYYLLYIKRVDAKHLSSFGTFLNSGTTFSTPPILPHGPNGIIIGHDAIIGKNVTIHQQVTIENGGAVIGDNVLLGAGCKVLGGVRIGNNAKVGANAVVIEDMPDNSTCVLTKPRIIIRGKSSQTN